MNVRVLAVAVAVAVLVVGAMGTPHFPTFDCPALPPMPPAKDVRHLRAQDISVVMALGDSMTAGFGMKAGEIWDVWTLVEYRGSVYSIGGNEGAQTLPNYLRHYNPNITGMSVGDSAPLDVLKWPWNNTIVQPFDPAITHLNAAQSGAKIQGVAGQVDYLESRLKSHYPEHADSWKMVTLLIGANNACAACKGGAENTPATYGALLKESLMKIKTQLNRTVVNIMPMFDVIGAGVYSNGEKFTYCRTMWDDILPGECPCMQGDATDEDRKQMDEAAEGYREQIRQVVADFHANEATDDFDVLIQPCISEMKVPDEGYLSNFDCFHPNVYADTGFAIGLWNNIWTPPAEKSHAVDPNGLRFKCPTVDDYIQ